MRIRFSAYQLVLALTSYGLRVVECGKMCSKRKRRVIHFDGGHTLRVERFQYKIPRLAFADTMLELFMKRAALLRPFKSTTVKELSSGRRSLRKSIVVVEMAKFCQ